MMLNPILTGWSMYYRYCAASETFRKTDQKIFNMIGDGVSDAIQTNLLDGLKIGIFIV